MVERGHFQPLSTRFPYMRFSVKFRHICKLWSKVGEYMQFSGKNGVKVVTRPFFNVACGQNFRYMQNRIKNKRHPPK
jgi:hypothetical protein